MEKQKLNTIDAQSLASELITLSLINNKPKNEEGFIVFPIENAEHFIYNGGTNSSIKDNIKFLHQKNIIKELQRKQHAFYIKLNDEMLIENTNPIEYYSGYFRADALEELKTLLKINGVDVNCVML